MVTMNRITDGSSEMDTSQRRTLDYLAPLSGRLPALERNILKYRALEMILVIFYCDHLKRKIRTVTDRNVQFENRFKEIRKNTGRQTGADMTGKDSMRVLREMELIDEDEAAEIRKLIDFRNVIAHQVQKVVSDVGGTAFVREIGKVDNHEPRYIYGTVDRLKYFVNILDKRIRKAGLTSVIGFDCLEFEAAEKTYETELERLNNTIYHQYEIRKQTVRDLNEELSLPDAEWGVDHHPRDPENKYANGRLTERGIRMCYRLYELGKSPMAVALLMEMSLRAAKRRQAQWEHHRDRIARDN